MVDICKNIIIVLLILSLSAEHNSDNYTNIPCLRLNDFEIDGDWYTQSPDSIDWVSVLQTHDTSTNECITTKQRSGYYYESGLVCNILGSNQYAESIIAIKSQTECCPSPSTHPIQRTDDVINVYYATSHSDLVICTAIQGINGNHHTTYIDIEFNQNIKHSHRVHSDLQISFQINKNITQNTIIISKWNPIYNRYDDIYTQQMINASNIHRYTSANGAFKVAVNDSFFESCIDFKSLGYSTFNFSAITIKSKATANSTYQYTSGTIWHNINGSKPYTTDNNVICNKAIYRLEQQYKKYINKARHRRKILWGDSDSSSNSYWRSSSRYWYRNIHWYRHWNRHWYHSSSSSDSNSNPWYRHSRSSSDGCDDDSDSDETTLTPTSSTKTPTQIITNKPSSHPIITPTLYPTPIPTKSPSFNPTKQPSWTPSYAPTLIPTPSPTRPPIPSDKTHPPTSNPTAIPTIDPSTHPTSNPTVSPSTREPTSEPTNKPTPLPTDVPSEVPTPYPTKIPSLLPTKIPSLSPTVDPSMDPTSIPTSSPTKLPTSNPTNIPTVYPTVHPSSEPTKYPSLSPTQFPTSHPTNVPTETPTAHPSSIPTVSPTLHPSDVPTSTPSSSPTLDPTNVPTKTPTIHPSTVSPTLHPSGVPTSLPSLSPTLDPTKTPTIHPSYIPTVSPTIEPSDIPTSSPSSSPTVDPTNVPTKTPTIHPSSLPTVSPTLHPSDVPTSAPSSAPTLDPTPNPTRPPTLKPTRAPLLPDHTHNPSFVPTPQPTTIPSNSPTTSEPTFIPSDFPVPQPTDFPTSRPTLIPTLEPTLDRTCCGCTIERSEAGCRSDSVCESIICNIDQDCCDTLWDSICIFGIYGAHDICIYGTNAPTDAPTSIPTVSPTEVAVGLELYIFYNESRYQYWNQTKERQIEYAQHVQEAVSFSYTNMTGYSMDYNDKDIYTHKEWKHGGIINWDSCYIFDTKLTTSDCPYALHLFTVTDAPFVSVSQFQVVSDQNVNQFKYYLMKQFESNIFFNLMGVWLDNIMDIQTVDVGGRRLLQDGGGTTEVIAIYVFDINDIESRTTRDTDTTVLPLTSIDTNNTATDIDSELVLPDDDNEYTLPIGIVIFVTCFVVCLMLIGWYLLYKPKHKETNGYSSVNVYGEGDETLQTDDDAQDGIDIDADTETVPLKTTQDKGNVDYVENDYLSAAQRMKLGVAPNGTHNIKDNESEIKDIDQQHDDDVLDALMEPGAVIEEHQQIGADNEESVSSDINTKSLSLNIAVASNDEIVYDDEVKEDDNKSTQQTMQTIGDVLSSARDNETGLSVDNKGDGMVRETVDELNAMGVALHVPSERESISLEDDVKLERVNEDDKDDDEWMKDVSVKQRLRDIEMGGIQGRRRGIQKRKSVERLKHAKVVYCGVGKFEGMIKEQESDKTDGKKKKKKDEMAD